MNNKALYLLAEFDDKTENELVKCYGILKGKGFIGKQTKDIPYHFTLGSFEADKESWLKDELKKLCSQTSCIDIRLDHIGLFGLDVMFIEPNMNFELLTLQKRFFDNCGNGCHPWTAHATILLDEPENILKALPIVVENFKPRNAQIKAVSLYEFFPTRFIEKCDLI